MHNLFTASLHVHRMAASGEALVSVTHLGRTKISFFFGGGFQPPHPQAKAQIPFWLSAHYDPSADVWVCSSTASVGFKYLTFIYSFLRPFYIVVYQLILLCNEMH